MEAQTPRTTSAEGRPASASAAPERPNGPVAAALLATGVGAVVLAILVIAAEASVSFADSLAYSQRVGPLAGKTIWAVAAFLGTWLVLGFALRARDVDLRKVTIGSVALIALALVGTFSPFFELFTASE